MVPFAESLSRALDPAQLALALGLTPDAWQLQALRSKAPRALWNVCRQGGKSTVASVLAIHQALYKPGSLTLLVSASQRQSAELFRTVTTLLGKLEQPPTLEEENKLSLVTSTGSRIVSLPSTEDTIRGYGGVHLLIEDEAARVADEVHAACSPMLATSGGRLLLMSTPYGKKGHFYQLWMDSNWERIELQAEGCPRIPTRFLAAERASLPAAKYRQEYECSFEEAEDSVFDYELLQQAINREIQPLWT